MSRVSWLQEDCNQSLLGAMDTKEEIESVLTTLSEIADRARSTEGKLNGWHVVTSMFFGQEQTKRTVQEATNDSLPREKSTCDATVQQGLESLVSDESIRVQRGWKQQKDFLGGLLEGRDSEKLIKRRRVKKIFGRRTPIIFSFLKSCNFLYLHAEILTFSATTFSRGREGGSFCTIISFIKLSLFSLFVLN